MSGYESLWPDPMHLVRSTMGPGAGHVRRHVPKRRGGVGAAAPGLPRSHTRAAQAKGGGKKKQPEPSISPREERTVR
jgi:hypothetical protein